jgi:hypothetical protein
MDHKFPEVNNLGDEDEMSEYVALEKDSVSMSQIMSRWSECAG